MQYSPDRQQKFARLILIWLMLLIALFFMFMMLFSHNRDDVSSYDLDHNGQKIGNGPSEYKIYQNQVYVSVPSNGDYSIPEADPQSIRMFSMDYAFRQTAVDKSHVYCGNLILSGIQPQNVRAIGDGYLTDGKVTYYCSPGTERNPQLGALQEVWRLILYQLGVGKKPQTYLYPSMKLDQDHAPYHIVARGIASNQEKTYFRGKLVDQANGSNIRYLPSFSEDLDRLRDSTNYIADGQHVYYKNLRVPIQDYTQLMVFDFGSSEESEFLYDVQKRNFYYHQYQFPLQNAPYSTLNKNNHHAHDPLFLSKQGIWFYNREDQELQRAGDNPFQKKIVPLAQDVFHNGQDTFYLGMYDKVIRSGKGSKLCYRATVLYRLSNTPLQSWQKIADVRYGGGMWHSGSVWRNGSKYYYFDEFGTGQGFNQAVYLIQDEQALKTMLNVSQSTDDIRHYLSRHILKSPQAEPLLKAKYDKSFCLSSYFSGDE